jgi:hypothetical protein
MYFLRWLWNGLRKLVGLVLPFWAKARDYQGWGQGLIWSLRILLLVVFFLVFWFLQYYLEEHGVSRPQFLGKGPNFLKGIWLPTLVVLVIVFFWVGWWVWKLWTQEEEESPFPDIDQAWEEAGRALDRAGIRIWEAPLYLVLGRPVAGEQTLFRASKVEWKIDQVPDKEEAPVHVYANRDAIFVTCPGASLLGQYASLLASAKDSALESRGGGTEDPRIFQSVTDVNASLRPEGRAQLIGEILAEAERAKRPLSETEKQLLRYLGYAPEAPAVTGERKGATESLYGDAGAIERLTARLEHLCRLIVRTRRPYCPTNGLLLLIPFAGTDERKATETATFCQRDVATVRKVFQLHFPCLALVSDMEKALGFPEFVKRFPQASRDKRFGQSFPWALDVDPAKLPQTLENGIGWVCHSLLAFWIYKFFQLETEDTNAAEVLRGNAQIFHLMAQMGLRHKDLSRILLQGLAPERTPLLLFGGCYVAGTGRKEQEQAFVPGIFDKIIRVPKREVPMQNLVYWTEQALREDSANHRRATIGWFWVAALSLVALGMVVLTVLNLR